MHYIIYQTAFLGDVILSTSMIKTIKQIDPRCKIIFITTPAGEIILRNDKRIAKVVIYDKRVRDKGFAGFLKKVKEIRDVIKSEDSVFLSPHRFLRASVMGYMLRSEIRAGFKGSSLAFLYNRRIDYQFGIHEIQRNFELLKAVFIGRSANIAADRPELFPSEADYAKVKSKVYDFFHKNDKIVSIAPGSVWQTKRWPYEYFDELIRRLQKSGIQIMLLGGQEDKDLCAALASSDVLNLAGELTVLESAAAISLCKALVTNDSAPLHIASAMNIPTVAVFGATTPGLGFGPLAEKSAVLENKELNCRPCGRHGSRKCKEKHFACMNSITPDVVLDAVIKLV